MKKIIVLTAASLFAAGCAAGAAKEGVEAEAPGPESIAFEFDWPDEMQTQVDFRRNKLIWGPRGDMPWEGHSTFTLKVEREGENQFEVKTEDLSFDFEGSTLPSHPIAAANAVLAAAMHTGMPSLTVAEVGDLVGVNGAAGILDAYAESGQVDLQGLPEEVRAQVDSTRPTVEGTIEGNARLFWTNVVGTWAGRELEVDQVVERRSSTPVPSLANQPVTRLMQYKVMGRVPCDVEVKAISPERPASAVAPAAEAEGELTAEAGEAEGELAAETGEVEGEMTAEAGEVEGEMTAEAGEVEGELTAEAGQAEDEPAAEADPWTDPSEIPGLGQGECVWIEVHVALDPETVSQAVQGAGEAAKISDVEQSQDVVVVTDPDGLIPHALRRVSTTRVQTPEGQQEGEQDVALWNFSYPAKQ